MSACVEPSIIPDAQRQYQHSARLEWLTGWDHSGFYYFQFHKLRIMRVMMQEPVAVRGRMARAQDAAAMLAFLESYLWRQAVASPALIDFCAEHLSAGTLRGGMIEEVHNRTDDGGEA